MGYVMCIYTFNNFKDIFKYDLIMIFKVQLEISVNWMHRTMAGFHLALLTIYTYCLPAWTE